MQRQERANKKALERSQKKRIAAKIALKEARSPSDKDCNAEARKWPSLLIFFYKKCRSCRRTTNPAHKKVDTKIYSTLWQR